MMTNFGYIINKNNYSINEINDIKNKLSFKPNDNIAFSNSTEYSQVKVSTYIDDILNNNLIVPKYCYIVPKNIEDENINIKMNDIDIIDVKFSGTLRDYQQIIINESKKRYFNVDGQLKKYGSGIICIPPGKGKTTLGLYLTSLIGRKTLIVVHKTFLMNQWIERIQQYLPSARIGKIQGDVIDIVDKDIVIGMLQSLCMKNYDKDIFECFNFTIFDEVHHLGAQIFSKVLHKIQSPFTLGLTATPQRKDGLQKVFYSFLDSIMYEQKADVDNSVNIKMYKYNISFPDKKYKIYINHFTKQYNMAKMITNLSELNIRNDFIIDLITKHIYDDEIPYIYNDKICIEPINGINLFKKYIFEDLKPLSYALKNPNFRKTLILSNRIGQLKELESKLINVNHSWKKLIGYYIGGMKQHQLKESENKFVIFATYEMASEGLDIPNLDTLMLITPKSDITQSIGRILRLQKEHRKNISTVYDIVDSMDIYISQGKKRFNEYISKDYYIQSFNVIDRQIDEIESIYDKSNHTNNNFIFINESD